MTTSQRSPVTVRLARWSAEHPWRAIGIWLLFVVLCLGVGLAAGTNKATPVDLGVGESGRAVTWLDSAGLTEAASENVVITAKSGSFDSAAAHAAAADVSARLRELPDVANVGAPITAPKGDGLLVPVTMRGDPDKASDHVEPLIDATKRVQRDYATLRVEQVGAASINQGIWDRVAEDLAKSEIISLPVTLVILLVVFGAILAAGVPVLLALSAVGAATGLSMLASQVFPDGGSTSNVIMLMGMAVGVDYSLFYLKREREERAKGHSHLDAVEIAAATSGHSVVVSAFAVIVASAGLFLANDALFSSLAAGMVLVVSVAMIGSLTVLPALLAKLGRRIDRPRVPVLWRLTNRGGEPRLFPALLRPVLRRPAVALLVSLVGLIALALPALDMNLKQSGVDDLPADIPAIQAYHRMTEVFPSENLAHRVVVKASATEAGEVRAALAGLAQRVTDDEHYRLVGPAEIRTSENGRVTTVDLTTTYAEPSAEAKASLRELRSQLLPAALDPIDGADYAVAGDIADQADWSKHLKDKLPLVIGFVLLLTFIMMAVTFRSVVVALTAIGVNLLSVLASFGLLVTVFQHDWAEGLLDFESSGTITAWIPLFLFVVLFGLSMDYHVFVVSRIREAVRQGMSTREAISHGISRSAGVVTSAAVVMVAVFSTFAALSMVEMKQMGVGLAAAVLIDAVVIRIVVLPSAMALLGKANWWPSRKAAVRVTEPEALREPVVGGTR